MSNWGSNHKALKKADGGLQPTERNDGSRGGYYGWLLVDSFQGMTNVELGFKSQSTLKSKWRPLNKREE